MQANHIQTPYIVIGEIIRVTGLAMLTQLTPTIGAAFWAPFLVVTGLGMGMTL